MSLHGKITALQDPVAHKAYEYTGVTPVYGQKDLDNMRNRAAELALQYDALIEQMAAALLAMVQHFPTDTDMVDAGWGPVDVERACVAHDSGKAALAAHAKVAKS